MIKIPFKSTPAFKEEILLDNIPYILEFTFNSRGDFWVLNIYSVDETLLIAGIKLVINYELISQFTDRGLPKGQLYVVRENQSMDRVSQLEFEQNKTFLVYFTEEELVTV